MKTKIDQDKKSIKTNLSKVRMGSMGSFGAIKTILIVLVVVFCSSCSSRAERLYNRGIEKLSQNEYLEAVDFLEDSASIDTNKRRRTKSLLEAARVLRLEIKDYQKALIKYRNIILESDDVILRLQAQEALAEIYFENLQDYQAAQKELLILEPLLQDFNKKEATKLRIAQSMRLSGALTPALDFIESALRTSKSEQEGFLKLKAQVFVSLKRYDEALNTYFYLLELSPEYFKKENLFIAQAMVFEEKQEYKQAFDFLTKHKESVLDLNYYELRIKRLQEKILNKPFSRGMRK